MRTKLGLWLLPIAFVMLVISAPAMMVDLDGQPILMSWSLQPRPEQPIVLASSSMARSADLAETPLTIALSRQAAAIPPCQKLSLDTTADQDPFQFLLQQERQEQSLPPGEFSGGCFVGDTLVQTPTGLQPIKDIWPGDYVLAMNVWQQADGTPSPSFGEQCWSQVQEVHAATADTLITILTGGGPLTATPGHPFLRHDPHEYTRAVNIDLGLPLVTSWGPDWPAFVLFTKSNTLPTPVDVYELATDSPHNFFVYGWSIGPGILVHNMKIST